MIKNVGAKRFVVRGRARDGEGLVTKTRTRGGEAESWTALGLRGRVSATLALAWLGGCASGSGHRSPGDTSLGQLLARDAEQLLDLFSPTGVAWMAVWIAATVAAIRGVQRGANLLWRAGFDPRRSLSAYVGGTQVALVLTLIYSLLARVLGNAPVLGSLLFCTAMPALLLVGQTSWQNLTSGIGILVRRQFREGDQLRVGDYAGIVRRCGLTGLELQCHDGSTQYLPARLVAQQTVTLDRVRNSIPVSASLEIGRESVSSTLDALRRTAWLSPYRSPSSAVDVSLETEGSARVVIQVSPRVQREASAHLLSALEDSMRLLREGSERPNSETEKHSG